jgi:hypothetical protein
MKSPRALRFWLLLAVVCVSVFAAPAAEETVTLGRPGIVIMLRHALAPGVGDPPGFDLRDCSTQRNLNEAGREQARKLGEYLRANGLREGQVEVFTSAWCRCRETAELLGLGEPKVLPALNSFFAQPREREATMEALGTFLRERPVDGPPIVLITHQVNITAFTETYPASGEGMAFLLNGTDRPRYLSSIRGR